MSAYDIRCVAAWGELDPGWDALTQGGNATPFQTPVFLKAWYETIGAQAHITPVIVEVKRRSDGALALMLPMSLTRESGLRYLTFADAGVADNTGPVIGPACPTEPAAFAALWSEIMRATPRADVFVVEKQPHLVAGKPNPILKLAKPRPSTLNARPLAMPETFEAYSRSRLTKFRKEQERVWRVFTRQPGTAFEMVTDVERGLAIYRDMERQQGERMADLGVSYLLNDPVYSAFYRRLIETGLASGAVNLGVLTANGETIGSLLGVFDGVTVAFVRISKAEGEWSTSSPGRLVIERTMMALHEQGVRRFDFSIGDYGYKENFNLGTEPLADMAMTLSWRGWPSAMMRKTRYALRASPLARRIKDRLKPPQSFARST